MIEGLYYFSDFITPQEHDFLVECIDNETWEQDLKRRVQQYGYKYDYKKRGINVSMQVKNIPQWADFLLEKIKKCLQKNNLHEDFVADQLIINEYESGQGIASHIDCEPCFEDNIISISLGGACVMNFGYKYDKTITKPMLLLPCSMLLMQQEARYDWLHGIKPKKTDEYLSQKITRKRRISLTFRKVILS